MQSYALAKEIQRRYGDIVEVIDFEKQSKHVNYARKQYGLRNWLIYGKEYQQMYRRFQGDLGRLPLSQPALFTNDYEKVLEYINGKYDIVVVGSDAVWSYQRGLGLDNPYWLFGDKLKCIKMSYAASAYGLDFQKVTQQEREFIGQRLASFDYIGVRDQETLNFVQSTGIAQNVHLNCDPTVMLEQPDPEEARRLLHDRFRIDGKKQLVSVMFGASQSCLEQLMNRLKRRGFQPVLLYHHLHWADRFNPWAPKILTDLSPYEWYVLYRAYYLNLTTYFHGTALALRSGVPTIAFDNTKFGYEYKGKVTQLMTDLGLGDFCIGSQLGEAERMARAMHCLERILEEHDDISQKINANMEMEKKKSDSFFQCLESYLGKGVAIQ